MKSPILAPKPLNKNVSIGGEEYEVLPEVVNEALIGLMIAWDKLGRPKSAFSDGGEKLMTVILATWQDLFPEQSKDWFEARKEYKLQEKSISEQVSKHTGRSIASIPLYVYKIMKEVFKEDDEKDTNYYKKLVKKYPIFKMANRI